MGGSRYSMEDRTYRSASHGYATKSRDEIFTQNKKREMHESMNPSGVKFRESRDSDVHPNAIPIQLYLDVTGSMGEIPHEMIKDGLPTLMGTLIQNGVPDAALMFGAIGDHETDSCPLQVAQFESGDAELDMWLTRTYIEGNGGGNGGESYLLAWYFAGNHIVTDAWEKRKQKGFVFTIGDEPCLNSLPASAVKEIMGSAASSQGSLSAAELLKQAQQTNHVFHIFIEHGSRRVNGWWRELMGDNLIVINDHREVPKVISRTILKTLGSTGFTPVTTEVTSGSVDSSTPDMIL